MPIDILLQLLCDIGGARSLLLKIDNKERMTSAMTGSARMMLANSGEDAQAVVARLVAWTRCANHKI